MTGTASDLIEGYALGLLDHREQLRARRAIASDDEARRRFESAMQTLDRIDELAAAGEPPPGEAVWRRIRREAGLDESPPAVDAAGRDRAGRWSVLIRVGWRAPVAVAAVVVLAVLSVRVVQLDASNRSLTAAASAPLAAVVDQAKADPTSSLVTLAGSSAAGTAVSVDVVYRPDGTGYLIGDSLPALDADRTYQLWAIVGDRVISAGVFGADPGIAPFQVVGEVAGLALTDEVAGGVVSSEQQPVALWLAGT
jgi:anti-sigma-K factor RskA